MTDTFEFTLDEESEKKLFEIMTDFNTEKTPSFTITDKYGNTAEYMKVVHGRWIENDNGTYSCSRCNSWIPKEQRYYAKFCLYCGARMVEERKEKVRPYDPIWDMYLDEFEDEEREEE